MRWRCEYLGCFWAAYVPVTFDTPCERVLMKIIKDLPLMSKIWKRLALGERRRITKHQPRIWKKDLFTKNKDQRLAGKTWSYGVDFQNWLRSERGSLDTGMICSHRGPPLDEIRHTIFLEHNRCKSHMRLRQIQDKDITSGQSGVSYWTCWIE